jgi:uncharacterized protein
LLVVAACVEGIVMPGVADPEIQAATVIHNPRNALSVLVMARVRQADSVAVRYGIAGQAPALADVSAAVVPLSALSILMALIVIAITLAFGFFAENVISNIRALTRGAAGMPAPKPGGFTSELAFLWLVIGFFALVQFVPDLSGPSPRDFVEFLDSDRGEDFFRGAWGWFAVVVVLAVFNVLGEELLFRGLLLPRMGGVFGRRDWVANGVIFAVYHLHTPWVIPLSLVTDPILFAYPSRRFESAWMGIIVHSAQSVVVIIVVLTVVLA